MAAKEIRWDRNKLYDQIWEKPATQVAKEYGISDVGLGKVCRQLNIPKPERGYWRRKELGLKVRKAQLPTIETVPRVVSSIYEREPEPPLSPSLQALAQLETAPERRIALPNELGESLHPLVKKTLSALQRGKASLEGYLQPKAVCVDLTITTQQLERATKIMEAVVRGLVARGHKVSVDADPPHATVAAVNGERLVFGMKEKVARRDRQLSASELRERKQSPHRYWPREYIYTPTGELTLAIRDSDVYGVPLLWRDFKRRKIEDCLNDIMFGFARAAERKAEIREERKRRAEEERERERIRYQKMLEIQKEEERIKRLHEDVRCWIQSEQLRSFVAARIRSFEQAGKPVDQGWVDWALAQAERLDPLRPSPASILDEKGRL